MTGVAPSALKAFDSRVARAPHVVQAGGATALAWAVASAPTRSPYLHVLAAPFVRYVRELWQGMGREAALPSPRSTTQLW